MAPSGHSFPRIPPTARLPAWQMELVWLAIHAGRGCPPARRAHRHGLAQPRQLGDLSTTCAARSIPAGAPATAGNRMT